MKNELKDFESSTLRHVEYDNESKELTVTFLSGSKYVYLNVGSAVFLELAAAQSKGKYFAANIKNEFEWRKL